MEYTKERILTLLRVVLFLTGAGLVVWGRKVAGYPGLWVMMGGLALMLVTLYIYNARNR